MKLFIIGIPRSPVTINSCVYQAVLANLSVVFVDKEKNRNLIKGLPVDFITVDDFEFDKIYKKLHLYTIDFLIAFSEFNLILAAQLREALHISKTCPTEMAEMLIRTKHLTRERIKKAGLSTVKHTLTTLDNLQSLEIDPPYIIKPVDLTGSMGVHLIRDASDITKVKKLYSKSSYYEELLLAEEFIHGNEISVEGLIINGKFCLLAITDKRTSNAPYFIEIGHSVPSIYANSDKEFLIANYVQKVATALEISLSPVHAELKIDGDKIELIEFHSRFGGDLITHLIEKAYGHRIYYLYYQALRGEISRIEQLLPSTIASIQFITAPHNPTMQPNDYLPNIGKLHGNYQLVIDNLNLSVKNSICGIVMPLSRVGYIYFERNNRKDRDLFLRDLDGAYRSHT